MPSRKYPTLPGGAPRTKKNGSPLIMGVTPGMISIARKGSPNVPGICLTSARDKVAVRDGSTRSPSTMISVAGSGGFGASVTGAAPYGFSSGADGGSSGAGAWNTTSKRMLAAIGAPSRVAGSKRHARAAAAAALENGSTGRTGRASRTRPSGPIVSVSTTVASPDAPSGYATAASETSFGGTTAGWAAGGGAAAGGSSAR